MLYCKGDVWYARFNNSQGSEQGGVRPVLIIQNNVGNKNSPTVIVALITKQCKQMYMPTHVELKQEDTPFLKYNSIVLAEQIRTIDKSRLFSWQGSITTKQLAEVNKALKISLNL